MSPLDQARRYVAGCDGAISGSGGHAKTFSVATALTNGFQLGRADALQLLRDYNSKCSPPWSERELEHKIDQAMSTPHDKPPGSLLNRSQTGRGYSPPPQRYMPPKIVPKPIVARYTPDPDAKLPEPIEDATRKFLAAVFAPGDGISICPAALNGEGREIPSSSGVVLTLEDWIRRLDAKEGDINQIFKSSDRTGIYFRVNPMRVGGAKDSDVTDWRYALLEFDGKTLTEQWSIYQQSKVPCAAIYTSGGKSVHALVKVDAKDQDEYRDRVRILHEHFTDYGIDPANKNPSRFSRLPGCERGDNRQDLLCLATGASDWIAWQTEREIETLGERFAIDKLLAFTPSDDPDCIIGDRYLSKGGSCLIVGPSGVGKSSLSLQMAIAFALDENFFGIKPKRALKSLFIQAENNLGDMAEMLQGVIRGMGLGNPQDIETISKSIIIICNSHSTGHDFCLKLERLLQIYSPDLVWIDPLLAYIGGEIGKQDVCSQFLRTWLNPVLKASGACAMIAHHMNKPVAKDSHAKKKWSETDLSYEGAGSAELVNWSRAVMVLQQTKEGNFSLVLGKRGKRAGAVNFLMERTQRLKLQHSTKGICWELVEEKPVAEVEVEAKPGRAASEFNADNFAAWMIGKGAHKKLATCALGEKFCDGKISAQTIRKSHWESIAAALKFNPETEKYSG